MKRILFGLIAASMIFTGCGANGNSATKETTAVQEKAENQDKQEDSAAEKDKEQVNEDQGGKEQGVEVEKNLLDVEVTIPASFFQGQDVDQVIEAAKTNTGIKNVTKNDDGSLTYKMTKKAHAEMMDEMKASIVESIESQKSQADFVSIKDIKYNEDFTEFTLVVDKSAFEGSLDGMAMFGLGMQGMFYQTFAGVQESETRTAVKVQDEATGEVFKTVVYPDAMKEE